MLYISRILVDNGSVALLADNVDNWEISLKEGIRGFHELAPSMRGTQQVNAKTYKRQFRGIPLIRENQSVGIHAKIPPLRKNSPLFFDI